MLNISQKKALDKLLELSFLIIFTRFLRPFALPSQDHLLFLSIKCMSKVSSKICFILPLKKWTILTKQTSNTQKICIF
jgi:hypothetical protein